MKRLALALIISVKLLITSFLRVNILGPPRLPCARHVPTEHLLSPPIRSHVSALVLNSGQGLWHLTSAKPVLRVGDVGAADGTGDGVGRSLVDTWGRSTAVRCSELLTFCCAVLSTSLWKA